MTRWTDESSDACERCPVMALMWPPVADCSRPGDQQQERLCRQRRTGWTVAGCIVSELTLYTTSSATLNSTNLSASLYKSNQIKSSLFQAGHPRDSAPSNIRVVVVGPLRSTNKNCKCRFVDRRIAILIFHFIAHLSWFNFGLKLLYVK